MRTTLQAITIVAGLASLAGAPVQAQGSHPWREVALPGLARHVAMDTMGRANRVALAAPQVWAALQEAYSRLQVRIDLKDSAGGVMGNLHTVKTYNIGSLAMSQAFDCGAGPSGPLADQARIHMAITSFVTPAAGDSTDLRIAAIATAEHSDGSARGMAWCSSTGAIETWLMDYVVPRSMRRR